MITTDAASLRNPTGLASWLFAGGIAIALFGVIYGQRLGWVINPDLTAPQQVPLCIATTYVAIFLFIIGDVIRIDATRLSLFCVTTAIMIVTTLSQIKFSTFSFFYLLILYAPFIFVVPANQTRYLEVLNLYQKFIAPVACIALLQFGLRIAGLGSTDLLSQIVPQKFVLMGYNTYAVLDYNLKFGRSNGIFFLEPSFISQFMALGILIEWLYFRRYYLMALYAGAIAGSLSGTGILMLIVVGGIVLVQRKQFWIVIVGIAAYATLKFLSEYSEILHYFLGRTDEFGSEGSSAYIRFVGPFIAIPDALGNNFVDWMTGFGPGNAKQLVFFGYAINPFVFSKLMLEYGVLGTIPFMIYTGYCILARRFSVPLTVAMFMIYNILSGSLQQPHTIFLVWLIGCVFVPHELSRAGHGQRVLVHSADRSLGTIRG
jgi:hypothetical protein